MLNEITLVNYFLVKYYYIRKNRKCQYLLLKILIKKTKKKNPLFHLQKVKFLVKLFSRFLERKLSKELCAKLRFAAVCWS